MLIQALVAITSEIFKVVFVVWNIKVRKLANTELKLNVASVSNFLGILNCLRIFREKLTHFLFGFQIKFVRLKFHSIIVVYRAVSLNTEKYIVGFAVLFFNIMTVVCCDNINADFICYANKIWDNSLLFFNSVVLKLNKEIVFAEQIPVILGFGFSRIIITVKKLLRNFTCKTG